MARQWLYRCKDCGRVSYEPAPLPGPIIWHNCRYCGGNISPAGTDENG